MMKVSEPDEADVFEGQPSLDDLFTATYNELRRIARWLKGRNPVITLTATVVVHEAWLKLAKSPSFSATSLLHFKRVAAQAMRRVVIDEVRRRRTDKCGGGLVFVTLNDSLMAGVAREQELLALDEALKELEKLSPRKVRVVELRFFVGQSVAEVAEALGVAEVTVHRDWKEARAWLLPRLPQAGRAAARADSDDDGGVEHG